MVIQLGRRDIGAALLWLEVLDPLTNCPCCDIDPAGHAARMGDAAVWVKDFCWICQTHESMQILLDGMRLSKHCDILRQFETFA